MNFSIPMYPDHDYLSKYSNIIDTESIGKMREERNAWFGWKGNQQYWDIYETVQDLENTATSSDFTGDAPAIGKREDLTDDQFERFYKGLEDLRPWRKGPLCPFDIPVDAEWRSNLKWDRVLKHLDEIGLDLKGKRVADIGCNNGYYMFKMLKYNPEIVIGFDPTMRYFMQFHYLHRLNPDPRLHYELLGAEHLPFYSNLFDVMFCMGILYHNVNPLGILRGLHKSIKKGGTIIIESQGIPGDEAVALFPEERYAKVKGNYFIPTVKCLENWLTKANFENIQTFHVHKLDNSEQRRTNWMRWESLDDFLDPNDPTKTVEGYPAPIRIYTTATRK